MTTLFRFRYQPHGIGHTRVRLFVGKKGDTLALSGEFTLRTNEWQAFVFAHGGVVRAQEIATFEFVPDVQP